MQKAFLERETSRSMPVSHSSTCNCKAKRYLAQSLYRFVDGTEAMRGYVRGSKYHAKELGVGLARICLTMVVKRLLPWINKV